MACPETQNGSIGWNCETLCKSGFYGYLCLTSCECGAHLCDKQTGCLLPQNDTSTTRTNNHTLTTLSTIVFEGTASQEEYTATTQARKQPTFSGNSVQENTIENVYIETFDQKRNISGTSVPSDNSSERRLQNSMSNPILFFIGSITTVFIGGAFICFRKRFMEIFIC
eukprot:XP_011441208.1 PREDICTED: uncharacterized protein LOC105337956 [Crassostrea gigas]